MFRKVTFVLFCLFVVTGLAAQTDESPLPRYDSPLELWQTQFSPPTEGPVSSGITTPPEAPVRTMAEWEELQALVISWQGFSSVLTEIVRAARLETKVIICCKDQSTITLAKNYLTSYDVDITSNVEFLLAPNNSIWVRDYGPNCVYTNNVDSLLIIDWKYNRPQRPLDDAMPEKVANYLNLPLYTTTAAPTDLIHTGGNFMSDGISTAFSSRLVLSENTNHTETAVNDIMQSFMGIQRYPKMNALPFDVIHHIDMHIKLLDEETLLVGQYPTGVADGPQIEANLQYVLNNFQTAFGTPYKVVRIPMPPDAAYEYPNQGGDYRTYANAVFVNKTILVPFYEEEFDTTAQRIWETAMPGYTVTGINCNQIIPSLGAIHCITKEIGVNDPLRIVHHALSDVEDNPLVGYPVYATLQHRSGIVSGKVFYATDPNGPWEMLEMAPTLPDSQDVWLATIPTQPVGSTIYYYIEGQANSGKQQVRPMPAPAGYWKFLVKNNVATEAVPDLQISEIFPNPAKAITCLPVTLTQKASMCVRVYNILGVLIETVFNGEAPAGENKFFLNATRYPSGTYMVEYATEGTRLVRKLVVAQ